MGASLKIDILTIFPGMLEGFLGESMLKRAARSGAVEFRVVNLRDFTNDAHRTTDDRPYGGGPGMVMKPEPIFAAVESLEPAGARVILMTPQGRRFDQAMARDLAGESHLIFVCGHYEGVDERVRQALATDEISIGDYVLTNGAVATAVVVDAVVRLRPGVLGGAGATEEESFSDGCLEYPQYTRPPEFRGMRVPDVLVSGDHEEIRRWRRSQSLQRTRERRPDLLGGGDDGLKKRGDG
ncbi:MAG TPA: tRNA (guanosine(37)-N1)-methyltransferase TrmD [Kiritimatiellia bacterium]|nr:tRNA (guanosine(37)-N1)-methyltransferase TrmD [Kiritimatiellia bacterium]HRZ11621.1 tRNA (guanosine(37)-N1)-methyltransferase TrmD [Kiritimatiellia bacterium]HSA16828.1 tRNA (guanosine(37)-N1)-methyltransferase TrmD [Kiritimatiellia bacterium]